MAWQSIDFQGIINFDRTVVVQLEQFLSEKENRLAGQIFNIFSSSVDHESSAPLLPSPDLLIKISDAIEEFNKHIRLSIDQKTSEKSLVIEKIVKDLNQILWEFTEVLEGCAVELFQQIHQMPIYRWQEWNFNVVRSIKDAIIHYIDDLVWMIRRLEHSLRDNAQGFSSSGKKKRFNWSFFVQDYLDSNLSKNLHQTELFLKEQYEAFQKRYHEYMRLNQQVDECLGNIKNYSTLLLLDVSDQHLYIQMTHLLKLLELNPYPKQEVAIETVKALKLLTGSETVLRIFRIYTKELKHALFEMSFEWKLSNRERGDLEKIEVKCNECQSEIKTLMHTMGGYRTFLLRSDPNPYVRSRWGFSEWIVGPEPAKAKKLASMIFSIHELEDLIKHFSSAIKQNSSVQDKLEQEVRPKIDNFLHEMGQPLISHSMMKKRSEILLEELMRCDELGSPYLSTIDYFEDVLSKVMRQDWKYHVLHEIHLFHQIYQIHLGLVKPFEDPAHAFRLERFHLLIEEMKKWIEKNDVDAHVHEIEVDMNDMRTFLQDFLASVQRIVKDKSQDPFIDDTHHKLRQQLMEYRYLFGQFFLFIISKSLYGVQLRHQFLFVDQYFESIENLLDELHLS